MGYCKACNAPVSARKSYCNLTCLANHKHEVFISNWLAGIQSGLGVAGTSNHVRRYLFAQQGGCCLSCKRKVWQGRPIPLELDHLDGNSFDCSPGNVRLLCATCHALTPTYKGRNKGNGKISRSSRMEAA